MYSKEHQIYLKKLKKERFIILFFRIFIIISFIFLWEVLARRNIINTFLLSSPSNILKTTISLFKSNDLLSHIFTTTYEVIISFLISSIISLIIATIFWSNKIVEKILDPYLTIINSLPKVSLGPLIIILFGANTKSIIFMAILIIVFTSTISMYNTFMNTDSSKITLLKSFGANKIQIFTKLILPSNITSMINILKINISLSLIGVIMGELLVSKKGLGYLITYGSQVFNLNLVITSIFILAILSYLLYFLIDKKEKNQK